jgi:transglutaminase-like putative cysteine protease
MIYRVVHQIRYTYSASVFLEPHIVRLRPRADACQQVDRFTMTVDPRPVAMHDFLDAEGNSATTLWFEEMSGSLSLATSFEVHTLCANPFGYLVTDPGFLELPVRYTPENAESLAPFLGTGGPDEELASFSRAIRAEVDGSTLDFLSHLCAAMYEQFTVEVRSEGQALPPGITLAKRGGACRDLALLFVEICRGAGIAARFVSGYQEGEAGMEDRHLHAWAEVYIPGGGWRGYDPSHGLAVADRHIPLAASRRPAGAAPVTGSFRGSGVTAKMDFQISLDHVAS